MQQLAFRKIFRDRRRVDQPDILQVIAVFAKFNRADLAETEMRYLMLAQNLSKPIGAPAGLIDHRIDRAEVLVQMGRNGHDPGSVPSGENPEILTG